jgi:hypothetical protein
MFAFTLSQTGILGLFAGLLALLILGLLTSKHPHGDEAAPVTAFDSAWLARAPDDVQQLKAVRTGRRFLTLELLANCTWECCSQFRDAIGRIRRGY